MSKNPSTRAYGRTELALKYSPDSTPQAAWRRLRGWLEQPLLKQNLQRLGYDGRQRVFSPRQVALIISWLGDFE